MSDNTSNISNDFKFFHNAETRLYIQGLEEKETSIFSNVYKAFFSELKDKLSDIRNIGNYDKESQNNLNNIFAFVGERGSGKTSCMLSIAKMLEEESIPNSSKDNIKYSVLETIDPSFFDVNTNILDIVLGRMFSAFKKEWDSGKHDSVNEKNQLLESFEKVKQSISQINAKRSNDGSCFCEEDNVDKLINLSASVNLKWDIHELIQKYLKFFSMNILVIPIDDIDLHSKCAYEMVEQIRKYLIQYNVIILMALKIEQLDKVVESNYVKEFNNLFAKDLLSSDDIANMANKYLIKLIPDNHRFVLPTIDVMYDKIVNIYEKTDSAIENSVKFLNQNWNKIKINSGYPARYIILKLIFDKTRYLFYHMHGSTSMIIPRTLREYNQLLEMLLNMDDYEKIKSMSEKLHNKSVFKNYFIQSWCRSNLREDDCSFIKELFAIADPSIINKIVTQKIINRYQDLFEKKEGEVEKILNDKNKTYNISVGDVNLLLRLIKGTLTQYKDKAFIFAIETFYSIKLYEYYDLNTEQELKRESEKIEKEVVVKSVLDEFEPYEIIVGGSLYNLKSDDGIIIPRNGIENKRRDRRIISLKTIRDSLKNLIAKDELQETEKKEFRLIEFFALFTLRRSYDLIEDDESRFSDYRIKDDVVYASVFSSGQEYIWFDIMSVFSNLPNVKRCYNRIDEKLFDKAEKMEDSLYNLLIDYCKKNRTHTRNGEHALLSYSSIRNMEILNDFFNYLKVNFGKRKYPADNRKSLMEFFKGVQGYVIKSYKESDENENADTEWRKIDFGFVEKFIDVLQEDEIQDKFDRIFKSINENKTQVDTNSLVNSMKNLSSDDLTSVAGQLLKAAKVGYENKSNVEKGVIDLAESMIEKSKKNNLKNLNKIDNQKEIPPIWEIIEDLNKLFDKSRYYSTAEVRRIIRDELRREGLLNDNATSWIGKNVRNALNRWSNPEIEKIIETFATYYITHNRKIND